MARRSLFAVAMALATILILVSAVPALGYGYANEYHLRLYRLDPIACGVPITLKAELVNVRPPQGKGVHYRGPWVSQPVSGATVNFSIAHGAAGDWVAPSSTVTNSNGKASVEVKLDCSRTSHKIVAYAPEYKAAARITLITNRPQGIYGPVMWRLLDLLTTLFGSH